VGEEGKRGRGGETGDKFTVYKRCTRIFQYNLSAIRVKVAAFVSGV
jgi:hypothetical protein